MATAAFEAARSRRAAVVQPTRSPRAAHDHKNRRGRAEAKHSIELTCSACGRQADDAKLRLSGKVRHDAAKCADATIEPMPPKTMNEWSRAAEREPSS